MRRWVVFYVVLIFGLLTLAKSYVILENIAGELEAEEKYAPIPDSFQEQWEQCNTITTNGVYESPACGRRVL